MKRFFTLILVFYVTSLGLYAQQNPVSDQLYFKRLTVDQGLSETSNYFVFQDSRGYIWISSTSGLNRFDGHHVEVFREIPNDSTSLKGSNVNGQFSEDSNGNIWFSTYNAVNCYDRMTGTFSSYQLVDHTGQEKIGYFTCGLDMHDQLWVKHEKELYRFDINKKKFHFTTSLYANYQHARSYFNPQKNIKYLFFLK